MQCPVTGQKTVDCNPPTDLPELCLAVKEPVWPSLGVVPSDRAEDC